MNYVTLTFSKLRSNMSKRSDHMTTHSTTSTTGTHALRLLRALAEEGKLVFSTPEAREAAVRAGIPNGYLYELLHHMTQSGLLTRLRRGLYATSEVASGRPRAHPFAIATQLVRPSAISHWSALSHHGLTDQVPRVVTAFTPKKVVTPSMRSADHSGSARHAWKVAGVAYEYVSVRKNHFFGIEQVWVDENSRVPIADRERTVLETFISPRRFGGIGVALGLIESYARQLQLDRLVEYALRYAKISVAKRLGWALDRAHADGSLLLPLQSMPATRYYALDPARPSRGPCDRRWMIQDNLQFRSG
jgi:predicted transcriptional regulator of viral defense system